jgi:hypothetical protein
VVIVCFGLVVNIGLWLPCGRRFIVLFCCCFDFYVCVSCFMFCTVMVYVLYERCNEGWGLSDSSHFC